MIEMPYKTNHLLNTKVYHDSSSASAHRFQNRLLFDVFGSDALDFPSDSLDTIKMKWCVLC
jgi:hypothetical protein